MKVKFVGVPGEEHKSIPSYGYTFPLDKWVDVPNTAANGLALRKLKNHPHFETQGGDEVTDVPYKEAHDYQRDGAAKLANATGDHDIATAQLQGKEPAPNAKAGLVPDMATDAQKTASQTRAAEVRAKLAAKPSRADLEALAVAVGVRNDGRWSDERLRDEIEKAA